MTSVWVGSPPLVCWLTTPPYAAPTCSVSRTIAPPAPLFAPGTDLLAPRGPQRHRLERARRYLVLRALDRFEVRFQHVDVGGIGPALHQILDEAVLVLEVLAILVEDLERLIRLA